MPGLLNPYVTMGMGILGGNKGPYAFQNAMQGGLLGGEQIRRNQLAESEINYTQTRMDMYRQMMEERAREEQEQQARKAAGLKYLRTQNNLQNLASQGSMLGDPNAVPDALAEYIGTHNDPVMKQMEMQADMQPDPLAFGQPKPGIGPDGKRGFFQMDQYGNAKQVEGWKPEQKAGIELTTNPDGSMSFSMGGDPLSKSTRTKNEQSIMSLQEAKDRWEQMFKGYKPKYLTYPYQAKQKIQDIMSKITGGGNLSQEELGEHAEFVKFRTNVQGGLNEYIREITGAVVNASEVPRLFGAVPNMNDSPVEFISKLQTVYGNLQRSFIRKELADEFGVNAINVRFGSKQMDSLINKKATILEKQYIAAGLSKKEAEAETEKDITYQYGMLLQ